MTKIKQRKQVYEMFYAECLFRLFKGNIPRETIQILHSNLKHDIMGTSHGYLELQVAEIVGNLEAE